MRVQSQWKTSIVTKQNVYVCRSPAAIDFHVTRYTFIHNRGRLPPKRLNASLLGRTSSSLSTSVHVVGTGSPPVHWHRLTRRHSSAPSVTAAAANRETGAQFTVLHDSASVNRASSPAIGSGSVGYPLFGPSRSHSYGDGEVSSRRD